MAVMAMSDAEISRFDTLTALFYMQANRTYLERHGKPIAFYVDRHSVFRNNRFLPSYLAQHNARWPQTRVSRRSWSGASSAPSPTPLARTLARKRVHVCEFSDGRIEVWHGEVVLPYRVYDKMQRVNRAEIVENKRLGATLAMAQALQSANPHHRQRNNNAPVRSSQSIGVFAPSRQDTNDGRLESGLPKRR